MSKREGGIFFKFYHLLLTKKTDKTPLFLSPIQPFLLVLGLYFVDQIQEHECYDYLRQIDGKKHHYYLMYPPSFIRFLSK